MVKQMRKNCTISAETIMLIPNVDGIYKFLRTSKHLINCAYIVQFDHGEEKNIWRNINQKYCELVNQVNWKENFTEEQSTGFIKLKFN
jgi:hypothetical protein